MKAGPQRLGGALGNVSKPSGLLHLLWQRHTHQQTPGGTKPQTHIPTDDAYLTHRQMPFTKMRPHTHIQGSTCAHTHVYVQSCPPTQSCGFSDKQPSPPDPLSGLFGCPASSSLPRPPLSPVQPDICFCRSSETTLVEDPDSLSADSPCRAHSCSRLGFLLLHWLLSVSVALPPLLCGLQGRRAQSSQASFSPPALFPFVISPGLRL